MNQRKLKLSLRLSVCADFVRAGTRLADIGTDHAYLPISLLLDKKIESALACDVNQGPLDSARANAVAFGVTDQLHVRLSDGLKAVKPEEADDIVVAGMGGELILRIISETQWLCTQEKSLVLQPMSKVNVLRKALAENGFLIQREKAIFEDSKIYTVMSVQFSGSPCQISLSEEFMGKLDPQDTYTRLYAQKVLSSLKKQCVGLGKQNKKAEQQALTELMEEIKMNYIQQQ